jgi:hypothetical protein
VFRSLLGDLIITSSGGGVGAPEFPSCVKCQCGGPSSKSQQTHSWAGGESQKAPFASMR